MKVETIRRVAGGYGLIITMAAGGLAFANIFGVLAMVIQSGSEPSPDTTETVRTWMHIGWVFGVCVALLGAVAQMRKRRAKQDIDVAPKVAADDSEPEQDPLEVRRKGLFASAAWGGFFGALIGAFLGATFVLLWFSIAYSPFAPRDWVSSISTEWQRVGTTSREEPVTTTNHPVALIAFGLPVALGTITGAAFGGIVRVTDEPSN